jgi:predicted transcriptional regulator
MKHPVHPGEILREDARAELELSVSDAAERLGVSRVTSRWNVPMVYPRFRSLLLSSE